MSDSNHDEMLSEFTAVTGIASDRAKFYLESTNWNLQLALSSYYETDQDPDIDDNDVEPSSQPSQAPISFSGSSSEPSKAENKSKDNKKYNAGGARIMTLNNMSSDEEEDDGTGQAFYAGGSDSSGQQVLGPSRNKNNKDFVSNIFKSAKDGGAEVVENPHPERPSGSRSFAGAGYRLGQTNDDHVLLADTSSRSTDSMDPIILRLWRQGFTINDSELRLYEDQKNREFLEYITKGELPPELRQAGNMVPVNMEDHRHEDFKAASKMKPFSGKGHTLGSPTPTVNDGSTSIASVPQTAAQNEENEKLANEKLNLDTSQPTTSIQIRLADGSRLSGRFNMSHTINDLRSYVVNARPQYAAQTFALLTTFPSKELTDHEQTIEKAGLANAAIMQRLK